MVRQSVSILCGILMLASSAAVNAGPAALEINGNIKMTNGGIIVFPDGSTQGTATLQGPKGDQGLQGLKGDPGSVSPESICAIYSVSNAIPPTFCPSAKIVFVTSQQFTGDLGGLDGADLKCQFAAEAGGLQGTYKAWLSSRMVSAKDRLPHQNPGPYYRTNGSVLADNWTDLTDGALDKTIGCDEFKQCSSGDVGFPIDYVWTGTKKSGDYASYSQFDLSCVDWTSSIATFDGNGGFVGSKHSTDRYWTEWGTRECNSLARLYCIQQ